jgi:hypothetical protein
VAGLSLAWAIRARPALLARCAGWTLAAVLAAVLAAAVCPGIDGVRRWIPMGPLRVNAAMLTLPAALGAIVVLLGRDRPGPTVAASQALQVILLIQPDASQGPSRS